MPAAERQGRPFERVRAVLADRRRARGPDAAASTPPTATSCSSCSRSAFEPGEDGAGTLRLVFAGDGEIALDVECLDVRLVDVTRPYLARQPAEAPET